MKSEVAREILGLIDAEATRRPSTIEFELAYQCRVAIDCIRFAIKASEATRNVPEAMLQLLDARDRLQVSIPALIP